MLHSNDHKPTNYFEKNVMQYLTLSKLGAHARTHKCTATQCADLKQANILEKKKVMHQRHTCTNTHPHSVQTFMLKPANIWKKKSCTKDTGTQHFNFHVFF